jgi:hypothetical protein
MTTGALLDALIEIAEVTKADFAMDIYMTPSGLSLILSGKRLPALKEKEKFSQNAARVLAKHIFSTNCHFKFKDLFPIIYKFNSQHELEAFLENALEYYFDRDWAVANEQEQEIPDRGITYLADDVIMNTFCVVLSDWLLRDLATELDIYSSLPFFSKYLPSLLKRIRILWDKQRPVKFNQAIYSSELAPGFNTRSPLEFIYNFQEFCKLSFWQPDSTFDNDFILLKDQLLILFGHQLDNTLSMTIINDRSYVQHFYEKVFKNAAVKLTYNREDVEHIRSTHPGILASFAQERQIESSFIFSPIGLSASEENLIPVISSATERKDLLSFFEEILSGDGAIFFSDDALKLFIDTGRVHVPFYGAFELPPSGRTAYLRRMVQHSSAEKAKFHLIYSNLSRMVILCMPNFSLVYTVDHSLENEKIHLLPGADIGKTLKKQIEKNSLEVAVFNQELWDKYLQEKIS